MSTSQNGWIANNRSVIVKTYVPGTDRYITTRNGDVAKIFAWLLGRFHNEVEPIDGGIYDDWGYAERNVRGSSTRLSNHASGTGIDVNATRHPLGAINTFDPAKEQRIREILRDAQGAIRWGGDYDNRKDEMHFEINVSPSRLREIVKSMGLDSGPGPVPQGRPAPTEPQPAKPVLNKDGKYPGTQWTGGYQAGSRGYRPGDGPDENIDKIQERIGYLLYNAGTPDGKYGPKTEAAVRDFQQNNTLPVDGIIGSDDWEKLFSNAAVKRPKDGQFNFGPPYPGVLLKRGSRGPIVATYQRMMQNRGWKGMVDDGYFGPTTHRLTVEFQKGKGLKANGIVGSDTWNTARSSNNK